MTTGSPDEERTVSDPLNEDDHPHEECGVFGVVAPGRDVSRLAFYALHALQHRGQESAGIAVRDAGCVMVQRDLGLVSTIFDEPALRSLTGDAAIGHVRYSTTGANKWDNAQPVAHTRGDDIVALGHNGNLTNTGELREEMERAGMPLNASTDSEIITAMLAAEEGSLLRAVSRVMPRLVGAYSIVTISGGELVAFRDAHGVRPQVIGRLDDDGGCEAKETCAHDQIAPHWCGTYAQGRRAAGSGRHRERQVCRATSPAGRPSSRFLRPPRQPDGRPDGWESRRAMGADWPARRRPTPTSSSACPTAAPRRPSATRSPRASRSPRPWCATVTWDAASSSPIRRCARSASG